MVSEKFETEEGRRFRQDVKEWEEGRKEGRKGGRERGSEG